MKRLAYGFFMTILGIDPGIGRMGWGVISIQNSELRIQNYGCIETKAGLPVETRLKQLHENLSKIIKENKPEVLAIEEMFFGANAKTAMVVGQARGVALLSASLNNMLVASYTPLQVKVALTGYGRGEKSQVGQMVKVLLKLSEVPKPDDTADALAIAITHAVSSKTRTGH